MIKKEKNKSHALLLGSFIILLGIAIPTAKYLYFNHLNNINDDKIEEFFEETNIEPVIEDEPTEEVNEVVEKPTYSYDYIAVLEIPSISLKRGLVSINDKNNNVNKNIEILKNSTMPDVENGNLILAGHSGSSYISFFKNLERLNNDNLIYIYYNNVKYTYKVVNSYLEIKDGNIVIHRNMDKTTLTLTTCSQKHKGKQLIVISELVKKENY